MMHFAYSARVLVGLAPHLNGSTRIGGALRKKLAADARINLAQLGNAMADLIAAGEIVRIGHGYYVRASDPLKDEKAQALRREARPRASRASKDSKPPAGRGAHHFIAPKLAPGITLQQVMGRR